MNDDEILPDADDEIVKEVMGGYWYGKRYARYAITRENFEAALREAMEKAREDEAEKWRADQQAEDVG